MFAPSTQAKVKVASFASLLKLSKIFSGHKFVHRFLLDKMSALCDAKKRCREFLEEKLDNWDLDVFTLAEVASGKPLAAIVASILEKRGISAEFNISKLALKNFLSCLEDQYDDKVPYHNSSHAADVTHSVHVLLKSQAFDGTFTKLEVFAALFAAAVHDAGHPGWSNGFLAMMSKAEGSEGASRGNRSYLEERHLLTAFQVLERPNCNILSGLDALQLEYFKRLVTDMVLATDMARHADLMIRVQRIAQQQQKRHVIHLETYEQKISVLQFVLHSADLSNPTKCFKTCKRFADCLFKELFELGDQEKILRFQVSPNCDRLNVNVANAQVNFITVVAEPLWKLWHELVKDDASEAILKSIRSNLIEWHRSLTAMR